MVYVVEPHRRTPTRYSSPTYLWGDDIHEAPVLHVEELSHLGDERIYSSFHNIAETLRHVEEISKSADLITLDWEQPAFEQHLPMTRRVDTSSVTEDLRQRLANANDYFHRKATEVFNDKAALELLKVMYRDVVMEISNFDGCENGIPLAKLTAANFCEVGAKVIYITEAGQRFIDSLRRHGGT